MVRIIHVTSWLSSRGGGIPPVIRGLARGTKELGADCVIAGLREEGLGLSDSVRGVKMISGATKGPRNYGFSSAFETQLLAEITEETVIHSHGLWMYPGVVARKASKGKSAPLVISPHGMLEPWALENSAWKKRLAGWLFENKNLRSAGCIHALCEAEARNVRKHGLRNPIAIIPNGVDLVNKRSLPTYEAIEEEHPALRGNKRVLFLSRIHPKKGLPHLIRAWQQLASRFPDWVLLIAGTDQVGHESEMKRLAADLGLLSSVVFLGPLHGEAKQRALAAADIFVLPSFSEGFSMAILEAAASGLPVLMTPQCNFCELVAAGGAIEVLPEIESCGSGLKRLLSLSSLERKTMGSRGQTLVKEFYTWHRVGAQMMSVYSWLLGKTPRPDCVHVE